MKFRFKRYQNEEGGADNLPPSAGAPPEKTYDKAFVDKLRDREKLLEKEATDAKKKYDDIVKLQDEEKAKKAGDFEALKSQLLKDTDAQIQTAKKEKQELEVSASNERLLLLNNIKVEKLRSSLTRVIDAEYLDDIIENPKTQNLLDVVHENGVYKVVVVESISDRTQRFKVEKGKSVPFTVDDLANEIAEKRTKIAKPLNQSSGDGFNGTGGRNKGVDLSKLSANELIQMHFASK